MTPEVFWMVFVEGGRSPTCKHDSLTSAKSEAEQLAAETGRRVHVLAACESVVAEDDPEGLRNLCDKMRGVLLGAHRHLRPTELEMKQLGYNCDRLRWNPYPTKAVWSEHIEIPF